MSLQSSSKCFSNAKGMFWNVNLSQILKSRIKVNVNVNVIVYENHIRNSHHDKIAKQSRKNSEHKSKKCENIKKSRNNHKNRENKSKNRET